MWRWTARPCCPGGGGTGKIKFLYLAPVAQHVFGNQAIAAQVERDFSACGDLLVANPSRIDSYWVEMVMFFKVNYEHIPVYGEIPMISSNYIRACIPARLNGWILMMETPRYLLIELQ